MAIADTTTSDARDFREPNNFFKDKKNKTLVVSILVAVILLAALWIWKAIEINSLKKESNREKEQLQAMAKQAIIYSHGEHLKLLAKPYVWAIRTEMLRGNLNQVNLYGNDMIKEKNFQSIVISDQKGIIVSSTDKKFEGKDFAAIANPSYLTSDTTIVEKINDRLMSVSSPIMGFNDRLGTLLITYTVPLPGFLSDSTSR